MHICAYFGSIVLGIALITVSKIQTSLSVFIDSKLIADMTSPLRLFYQPLRLGDSSLRRTDLGGSRRIVGQGTELLRHFDSEAEF